MIGLSSTTLEVTSMGIISDLIGDNSNSGAFVFGTISLFEKISNGVAVVMLERLKTCKYVLIQLIIFDHDAFFLFSVNKNTSAAAFIATT